MSVTTLAERADIRAATIEYQAALQDVENDQRCGVTGLVAEARLGLARREFARLLQPDTIVALLDRLDELEAGNRAALLARLEAAPKRGDELEAKDAEIARLRADAEQCIHPAEGDVVRLRAALEALSEKATCILGHSDLADAVGLPNVAEFDAVNDAAVELLSTLSPHCQAGDEGACATCDAEPGGC